MKDIVIVSATRTPIGSYMGAFQNVSAPQLGAVTIKESVKRAHVDPNQIDECLMGCVLTGGVGQAPSRQALIFSELPKSVRCTTINRVCGSGLKSVMFGTQAIQCGDAEIIVAGGMESMSRAPYLLERAREGYRIGHGKLIDSMISDGLTDVYHQYHMGDAAELCAKERRISRTEQDDYAKLSYERTLHSIKGGLFKDEIVPVEVPGKERKLIDTDEEPGRAKLDTFSSLKPAFQKEGTITAANASSLSDGASSVVLMSFDKARSLSIKPLARVIAHASHAHEPEWFTTAPVQAIEKLLKKTQMKKDDIHLFEINEAFSVVALACMKELGLNSNHVNIRGGAVALGHPLGATGARLLTTLIYSLISEKKRFGVVAMCIGGGEASSLLIENLCLT